MNAPDLKPARERHWICARRLRERRLSLGLTQREVVDRLRRHGNPTSNRALSAMENGRGLDLGLLPELAEVLGCSITYLLGLTSDPADWLPEHGTPDACAPDGRDTLSAVTEARLPVQARRPSPVPPAARWPVAAGILGPEVPRFAAPGVARRRDVPADGDLDERAAGAS